MEVLIITPDTEVYNGEAQSLVLPALDGEVGILDNHAPLITMMKPGNIRMKDGAGTEHTFDVKGGTVEVLKNKVTVLAE